MSFQILHVGGDAMLSHSQAAILQAASYGVTAVLGSRAAEARLLRMSFDLIVLCHSLPMTERHALARMVRRMWPETRILVLHASGSQPSGVSDAAVDSRNGPKAVLEAVETVLRHPQPVRARAAAQGRHG